MEPYGHQGKENTRVLVRSEILNKRPLWIQLILVLLATVALGRSAWQNTSAKPLIKLTVEYEERKGFGSHAPSNQPGATLPQGTPRPDRTAIDIEAEVQALALDLSKLVPGSTLQSTSTRFARSEWEPFASSMTRKPLLTQLWVVPVEKEELQVRCEYRVTDSIDEAREVLLNNRWQLGGSPINAGDYARISPGNRSVILCQNTAVVRTYIQGGVPNSEVVVPLQSLLIRELQETLRRNGHPKSPAPFDVEALATNTTYSPPEIATLTLTASLEERYLPVNHQFEFLLFNEDGKRINQDTQERTQEDFSLKFNLADVVNELPDGRHFLRIRSTDRLGRNSENIVKVEVSRDAAG